MSPKPSWDFPRTSVAAGHLLETGRAHGLTDIQSLGGTGITIPQIVSAARIEATQELEVARNLVRHLGDMPGLGSDAGLRYGAASLGVLGYALISSAVLREALHVGLRLFSLSHAFTRLAVMEKNDVAVIRFGDEAIPTDVRRLLVERDLAAVAGLLPFLSSEDSSSDPTALVVPQTLLEAPLPRADPVTAELCRRQCSELLESQHRRTGLAADVREILLRDPGAMPSMDGVAAELHLTGRTLERRLAADGTSYRALREEVLRAIALEILGGGLSVEAVGRRLGYSEVAAFSRAFKSWTGYPPSTRR